MVRKVLLASIKIMVFCFVCLNPFYYSAWGAGLEIKAIVEEFDPGAEIHVCWRLVKPGNPFLTTGNFNCQSVVKAVNAPFPGGGLNGDQLMEVVEKVVGEAEILEIRIRALTVGKNADDQSASMMNVDKGTDEFYNSYVGRTQDGKLSVFLDIEAQ